MNSVPTQEPDQSQSQSQSPTMASLDRLPPELKAQIVKELSLSIHKEPKDDVLSHPWLQHMIATYGEDVLATAATPLVSIARGFEGHDDMEQLDRMIEKALKEDPSSETKPTSNRTSAQTEEDDPWVDESEGPVDEAEERHPCMPELMKTAKILEEIAQDDLASLRSLSLVNREFAELTFPWLWLEVNLEETSIGSILVLVRDILPRHAHHVRCLDFGQSDPFVLEWDQHVNQEDRWPGEAFVREIEQLCQVTAGELTEGVRKRRARSLLIGKIAQMCPNIEKVDCEAFQKHPIPDEAYEDDPTEINPLEIYSIDHALQSIETSLGSRLTDLTLLMNDDGVSSEGDVASLLRACPNLLRVDLEIYCFFRATDERRSLHQALLGLNKLETLDIHSGFFINDDFARSALEYEKEEDRTITNPFPQLKCLALVECQDLSFESFHQLVDKFSPTLEVLDIDATPHANHPATTKKFLGRPFNLPRLRTLVLSTPHEPKFLDAFVNCKLVEFSLGFCPAFSYKDVEDFITLHSESLKRVEVADDASISEAQFESLEVFCHAKGISVELLEPDSEDDEDEDEEMNPSDLDEDDEGGWYDEFSEDSDGDVSLAS